MDQRIDFRKIALRDLHASGTHLRIERVETEIAENEQCKTVAEHFEAERYFLRKFLIIRRLCLVCIFFCIGTFVIILIACHKIRQDGRLKLGNLLPVIVIGCKNKQDRKKNQKHIQEN